MNSLFFRVLTYGLTIVVTGLVVGVLVVPTLVDWNQYKPEIEAAATAATGRQLTIGGNVRLDFLPAPALRLNGVRVANIEGGQAPAMVQADTVNIRVSLLALLSGRVEIDSISVLAPVISLETLADGRANWVFEPGAPPGVGGGVRVRLQRSDIKVTIEGGRLQYIDGPTAHIEAIDEVDAVIVASTVDGPYRASGQLTRGGLEVDFDGTFGPFTQDRPAPLKLAVWRSDIETRLRFSGRADLSPGRRSISGRLHGEADDFQALFAALSGLDRDSAPRLLLGDLEFDAVVSQASGHQASSSGGRREPARVRCRPHGVGQSRVWALVGVGRGSRRTIRHRAWHRRYPAWHPDPVRVAYRPRATGGWHPHQRVGSRADDQRRTGNTPGATGDVGSCSHDVSWRDCARYRSGAVPGSRSGTWAS